MNRAMRRAIERMKKPDPSRLARIDKEMEVKRELERNGITIKHLEENYTNGYKNGVNDSTSLVSRAAYAAAILALKSQFRFGKKRILRFLTAMDENLLYCIDRQDLIDEAWQKTGLKLVEDDPLERIQDA